VFAQVEPGRADQVADVLDEEHVELVAVEFAPIFFGQLIVGLEDLLPGGSGHRRWTVRAFCRTGSRRLKQALFAPLTYVLFVP